MTVLIRVKSREWLYAWGKFVYSQQVWLCILQTSFFKILCPNEHTNVWGFMLHSYSSFDIGAVLKRKHSLEYTFATMLPSFDCLNKWVYKVCLCLPIWLTNMASTPMYCYLTSKLVTNAFCLLSFDSFFRSTASVSSFPDGAWTSCFGAWTRCASPDRMFGGQSIVYSIANPETQWWSLKIAPLSGRVWQIHRAVQ